MRTVFRVIYLERSVISAQVVCTRHPTSVQEDELRKEENVPALRVTITISRLIDEPKSVQNDLLL